MSPTAASTLYFENTAGRIVEDARGFLLVVWGPHARTLADTQALFTHQLQALRRHGWSRILIDQRQMQPFSAEEQRWASQVWLPKAVQEAGYRHGALIVSPDVMVRLATAYITTQVQGLPLLYSSFEDETAAIRWLLKQPASALPQ